MVAVCCFSALLNSEFKLMPVKWLERIQNRKGLENALLQCHKVIETFEGSEETLAHIRRVQETLQKLMLVTD